MTKMIAVIDHTNRSDGTPDSIEVYPDTREGRTKARASFCEKVGSDLEEAESLEHEAALKRAEDYLHPHGSIYEVGEGYIAMIESGVTLEIPTFSGESTPCDQYDPDSPDHDCPYCHARQLLELSEKLLNVPAMYVDGWGYDMLRHIAAILSERAVRDHIESTDD